MLSIDSDEERDKTYPLPWTQYSSLYSSKNAKNKDDSGSHKIKHQKSIGWEVIEGLREDSECINCPETNQFIVNRRRKLPMKGWSKLYVLLQSGVLAYSKSSSQFTKRQFQGSIDLGLAVVSYKTTQHRIDIDANETFYHFKIKEQDYFYECLNKIQIHRLYRQWELKNSEKVEQAKSGQLEPNSRRASDTRSTFTEKMNVNSEPDSSLTNRRRKELVKTITLVEDDDDIPPENTTSFVLINEDFKIIDKELKGLISFLQQLEGNLKDQQNLSASNPLLYESNPRNSKCSLDKLSLNIPHNLQNSIDPLSLKMGRFNDKATNIYSLLVTVRNKLVQESRKTTSNIRDSSSINRLHMQLKEMAQQNKDLKGRLNRIKVEVTSPYPTLSNGALDEYQLDMDAAKRQTLPEMFYDAAEYLDSDSVSSASEVEEAVDEISDAEEEPSPSINIKKTRSHTLYQELTGRRDKLPARQADTAEFSLMNLLCKNIGRDLSKVRLPVILNEPLSVLQLLCEELEYSDLLDSAANSQDPITRMIYVMAFAVSGYASTLYRAATKPFNPVIGETFEYVRKDNGWKFIAEQVSHHPPISVAQCESNSWIWMQEFRLKNKFWGKSIEAIPTGKVKVYFKQFNESVEWNKVTTCIYNIFAQNRYLEHYGDMNFTSSNSALSGKLVFHKSGWGHQKYEVTGSVRSRSAGTENAIFGKWTEAVYSIPNGASANESWCVWRPGAMPEDYADYYGFTKFARDLNTPPAELDFHTSATAAVVGERILPLTDSRWRPDQRLLEQGKLNEAENEKTRVEELQRQRIEKVGGDQQWKPKWFTQAPKDSSLNWLFSGKYWEESQRSSTSNKLLQLW